MSCGCASDLIAILLVGGLGTRLRPVISCKPKPLATIVDRAFLEILVDQLRAQGIRHLVMSTGHLGSQIEDLFGNGRSRGVHIQYSRERIPLGTAGAIMAARGYLRSRTDFLVLNGDSFLELQFDDLVARHREHSGAVATIAVVRHNDVSRFGAVDVDANERVVGFVEKRRRQEPGLINGGVYACSYVLLQHIPEAPASLEKDVFPRLIGQGLYAREQSGLFVDIGTPAEYARAQYLLSSRQQNTQT